MAVLNYEGALARLLAHEGGYTNHPSDPGGPTNFGITIYDYRKYVKPGAGAADVKAMKVDEAKSIYRAKYWDACACDALPAGIDYAVFDYGVNSGIGRAKKVLQRVLGVTADGVFGDKTLSKVAVCEPKATVIAICDERLRFLKRLRTWPVFGKGWGRRVAEVKAFSLALAAKQQLAGPAPSFGAQQNGKGVVPVAKRAQRGSAGAIAAAGAAVAGQVHATGAGTADVAAIVVSAIVAAIAAYAFWSWRQRRQQEAVA